MSFTWRHRRIGTAFRKNTGSRSRVPTTWKPCLESLEQRQLLSGITAILDTKNVLQITGPGNEFIQIQQVDIDHITVVVVNGATGTVLPIQLPGNKQAFFVAAEKLTGMQVDTGNGTNTVAVGVHAAGASLYAFKGLVQVQGGTGVDTLGNYLFSNCILNGGGAAGHGHDNFVDGTASQTTHFEEPYDPAQPPLPGPGSGPDAAYTDIVQGSSNNCYFLAPLSSLAHHGSKPGQPHHLPRGQQLHGGTVYAKGTALPYLKQVGVTFNGTWTVTDPYEPQAGEFWTILYSRAFNQLTKGQKLPADGNEAWFALSGRYADGRLVAPGSSFRRTPSASTRPSWAAATPPCSPPPQVSRRI